MGACLHLCGPTMHLAGVSWTFFFLLSVSVACCKQSRKKMFLNRKLLGLWGVLEAIIFIWVCRTNLVEKDDEALFLLSDNGEKQ